MKLKLLAVMLLGLVAFASTSKAQTTYTLNKAFNCDAASAYPVQTLAEFICKINNPVPYPIVLPNFLDTNGNKVAFYFWAGINRVYVITSAFTVYNATYQLTEFTVGKNPDGSVPTCRYGVPCVGPFGTLTFTWSGTDTNGNPRNGSASWQWENFLQTGGAAREPWYHPQLQPGSTVTVNQ